MHTSNNFGWKPVCEVKNEGQKEAALFQSAALPMAAVASCCFDVVHGPQTPPDSCHTTGTPHIPHRKKLFMVLLRGCLCVCMCQFLDRVIVFYCKLQHPWKALSQPDMWLGNLLALVSFSSIINFYFLFFVLMTLFSCIMHFCFSLVYFVLSALFQYL